MTGDKTSGGTRGVGRRSENQAPGRRGTDSASTVEHSTDEQPHPRSDVRRVVIELDAATLAAAPGHLAMLASLTAAHAPTSQLVGVLAHQLAHPAAPDLAVETAEQLAEPLAVAWRIVMAGHAADRARGTRYVGAFTRAFTRAWSEHPDLQHRAPGLPARYRSTVRGLYNAGLPWSELRRAIDYVLAPERRPADSPFTYVKNIGWKWVREAREDAQARALFGAPTTSTDNDQGRADESEDAPSEDQT